MYYPRNVDNLLIGNSILYMFAYVVKFGQYGLNKYVFNNYLKCQMPNKCKNKNTQSITMHFYRPK